MVPATDPVASADEDLDPVKAFVAATKLVQAVADICSTHSELHSRLGVKWSCFSWSKSNASATYMLISILEALMQDSCGSKHEQDAKTKAISNILRICDTHFSDLSKPPSMTSSLRDRAGAVLRQFLESSDHAGQTSVHLQALELIFCKSMMPVVCPEPKDRLKTLVSLARQEADSPARKFLRKQISRLITTMSLVR